MVIIDISFIMFLCLFSAIGYKKGMLISLFSILCFIFSIYLTYLLLPYFVELLNYIFNINKKVGSFVSEIPILKQFIKSDSKLFLFIKYLLHIDANSLNDTITMFIINIISFIVLAIVLKFILKLLAKKISIHLKDFFIVGTFDRFCGLFFGFLKGVILICIISFVITSLMEFNGFDLILKDQVENSALLSFFNNGAVYIVKTFGYNILN